MALPGRLLISAIVTAIRDKSTLPVIYDSVPQKAEERHISVERISDERSYSDTETFTESGRIFSVLLYVQAKQLCYKQGTYEIIEELYDIFHRMMDITTDTDKLARQAKFQAAITGWDVVDVQVENTDAIIQLEDGNQITRGRVEIDFHLSEQNS